MPPPAPAPRRPRRPAAGGADRPPRRRLTGWRRWAFPPLVALLPIVLVAGGLELALRAAGAGFDPAYFLALPGGAAETTNPRFGWRFFPPALARAPVVSRLARPKEDGVYRVFVLGGSAAMGTPEPALGLPRVLEVMLEESFPGARFEVVNAAMAAINSHVVVDIARHCARREPDLFVVYLGNNEVVGPYGPGTVFTAFGSRRPAIRASLWLKSMRTGQLLARAADALAGPAPAPAEWRGMEMFVEHPVAADDPRLAAVVSHLEANLATVFATAGAAGAPVVVSTVAVNLADAPPFASRHRPGLDPGEEARFAAALARGAALLAAGRPAAALAALDAAAAVDDRHALLRYRRGRALLALDRPADAAPELAAARDLDLLRFRADSGVNGAIRRVAAAAAGGAAPVVLVDGEAALAAAAGGPPGDELFWEHVHLRFAGNVVLARALLAGIAPQLPEPARARRRPPPSERRCAERLAVTGGDRHRMAATIRQMTSRPPFTAWPDHRRRQAARRREVAELAAVARRDAAGDARRLAAAVARRPHDLALRERHARALAEAGEPAAAAAEWRALLARVPGVPEWRAGLAFALVDQGGPERLAVAERELRAVAAEFPESADAPAALATVVERRGRRAEAIGLYREVLRRVPSHTTARLNLARLLARDGQLAAAETLLRGVLAERPDTATVHARLAEVAERRGDLTAAADGYRRAAELAPEAARFHNSLGYALERLGRGTEAEAAYRRAVAADPAHALAWFNLGDLLLATGRAAAAAEAYGRGLERAPGNLQARYNRAGALAAAGDEAGAARGFRAVLAAEPGHPGALHNLTWILATSRAPGLADPAGAVVLGERAAAATDAAPEVLEALAVAYAAAGRREEAAATLRRAARSAREAGDAALAARLDERLGGLAP